LEPGVPAVWEAVGEKNRELRDAGVERGDLAPLPLVDGGGYWSNVRVLPAKGDASLLPRWLFGPPRVEDLASPMYVYLLL